jgi:hypothetical protein
MHRWGSRSLHRGKTRAQYIAISQYWASLTRTGHAADRVVALAGALGSLGLAVSNGWPHLVTQGAGVLEIDAALVATGISVMVRQHPAPTAALCLGLMTGKGLLLTLTVLGTPVPPSVIRDFTLLILLYMAGSLAIPRVWELAIGALVAAAATEFGSSIVGDAMRALWFLGLAVWLGLPVLIGDRQTRTTEEGERR